MLSRPPGSAGALRAARLTGMLLDDERVVVVDAVGERPGDRPAVEEERRGGIDPDARARPPSPGLDPQARRRAAGRLRARHPDAPGDRPAPPALWRRGALCDGARQRGDHQARGRDRHRARRPARARDAARGQVEDARGRALLGRGLPPAARDHPPAGQALLPGGGEVHRLPARGMRAAHAAALVLLAGSLACRGPRPEGGAVSCTHVQAERQAYGAALCEDVWTCARLPGGPFDRLGLHRLALCENATGPVVLYLPGMHMTGELPISEPRHDLRVYLAAAGVRTWGLDYRTHVIPADPPAADLETP